MKRAYAAATESRSIADVLMAKAPSSKKKQKLSEDEKAAKALLNKLTKQAISKIRKAGHTGPNKPLTTISLGIPSRAIGELALGRHGTITSDTKRMQRQVLKADAIESWLGFNRVDDAFFTGRTICLAKGPRPVIKITVEIEEVVATVEANMLTVKFKTWYDQNRSWREHMKAMDERKATPKVEVKTDVKKTIYTAPCVVKLATEGTSGACGVGVGQGDNGGGGGGGGIDAQHPMLSLPFPPYALLAVKVAAAAGQNTLEGEEQ